MPTSRYSVPAAILIAAAALAGCGAKGSNSEEAAATAASAAAAAASYSTIAAGKVDIEGGLVDIAARAPGIIEEVMVQEGDLVKAGDILARQDDREARLRRDRARAELQQAEAQLPVLDVQLKAAEREAGRLERLLAETAVSSQAYEQAVDLVRQLTAQMTAQRAVVNLSRAAVNEAEFQVELYLVRAPTDGRIVRRYANPGSGASTLQVTPLFQLQPDAQRIVRAEVEERSLTAVSVGQAVEIVPEADQLSSYPGTVIRIAGVMGSRKLRSDDPSERVDERVVEVVVDAEQAPVLVGQRVFVKFIGEPASGSGL
ncbi:efflux RND transporter periplasmic adaptor subunit [bacterium]|nr:efflux RND transporter periplasmic adaptor subunit [bacterium]